MKDDEELRSGIDKPTGTQYVLGLIVIVLLALLAYWWLSVGAPGLAHRTR